MIQIITAQHSKNNGTARVTAQNLQNTKNDNSTAKATAPQEQQYNNDNRTDNSSGVLAQLPLSTASVRQGHLRQMQPDAFLRVANGQNLWHESREPNDR